ncbi:MAG: hypothetical protein QF613_07725 [Candidatus Marinimicrobia bacterium]|jgi:hypothetical protein|nr:hypothetical protein [Candidatus Neomarinimicrobiota bacterium]MAG21632.1 hypothetical protein [Candidatus Neomarinimicrobiota bacterium]MDP6457586.1 hypothetical protein [Candidatus Neomarinimicrobiota bacterium]MDP6594072.1 hypothetical protein [Candidatus Neomarinimicrobiota bacterium]MDP6836951.1 hypothetical protein [Candidatus Neomarinimicrobiota bacterium]|tara:strand:+ start:504 stop:833 length:330 start_codon:yes stop_codon:yes gene_type:complete
MSEITIGAVVLIILIVVFMFGRSRQMNRVEADRSNRHQEKESWAEESVMSYAEVQKFRKELIKSAEEKMADEPDQVKRLKEIIDDWADLKVKGFRDRRSWVRTPEESEE